MIGALLLAVGHMAGTMGVASHLYGVRSGYRLPKAWLVMSRNVISLESCVVIGFALMAIAIASMFGIAAYWGAGGFAALPSILPVALAGAAGAIGLQTLFGGFLFAIIAGNEADFLYVPSESAA